MRAGFCFHTPHRLDPCNSLFVLLIYSPLPLPSPPRPLPQGVTHISRVTQYEQDVNDGTPDRWVAHFSHPLELELLSKGAVSASKYPTLLMQVNCCSHSLDHRVKDHTHSSPTYVVATLPLAFGVHIPALLLLHRGAIKSFILTPSWSQAHTHDSTAALTHRCAHMTASTATPVRGMDGWYSGTGASRGRE